MSFTIDHSVFKKRLQELAELTNQEIHHQRKQLLGQILTLIDASFSDPEQRKAQKDMVSNIFYQGSYWNFLHDVFADFGEAHGLPKTEERFMQSLRGPDGKSVEPINRFEHIK